MAITFRASATSSTVTTQSVAVAVTAVPGDWLVVVYNAYSSVAGDAVASVSGGATWTRAAGNGAAAQDFGSSETLEIWCGLCTATNPTVTVTATANTGASRAILPMSFSGDVLSNSLAAADTASSSQTSTSGPAGKLVNATTAPLIVFANGCFTGTYSGLNQGVDLGSVGLAARVGYRINAAGFAANTQPAWSLSGSTANVGVIGAFPGAVGNQIVMVV